jgi:hypothetical protein
LGYSGSMKIKTSLTISEDLLETLDRMAGPGLSLSAFVEEILRDYVEGRAQERREAREIAAINRRAAKLNAEMQDIFRLMLTKSDEEISTASDRRLTTQSKHARFARHPEGVDLHHTARWRMQTDKLQARVRHTANAPDSAATCDDLRLPGAPDITSIEGTAAEGDLRRSRSAGRTQGPVCAWPADGCTACLTQPTTR